MSSPSSRLSRIFDSGQCVQSLHMQHFNSPLDKTCVEWKKSAVNRSVVFSSCLPFLVSDEHNKHRRKFHYVIKIHFSE